MLNNQEEIEAIIRMMHGIEDHTFDKYVLVLTPEEVAQRLLRESVEPRIADKFISEHQKMFLERIYLLQQFNE